MSDLQLRIRAAREDDAAAVAAIYRPYVRDTAVSFEVEPPSPAVMAQRIQSTVETHPWLIAENGVREIVGYVYAGKHRERPAYRRSVDTTIYALRQAAPGVATAGISLRLRGDRPAQFGQCTSPRGDGAEAVGVHRDVGFKLGQWHDIGYWRLGLASGLAPTPEPIPFAAFQALPDFVAMS